MFLGFVRNVLGGVMSVLNITSSPLYRYPYRNTGEAMRGDWLKIGNDIDAAVEHLDGRDT